MATRLNPTNFGYQNFYSTTLTGDITSGTLTIGLATVPTPVSGVLIIEPDSTSNREVIVYTSKGASTITCPSDGRGYSGTTAAAHLTGSTVIMAPVDKWFTALASGELSTDPIRTEGWFDFVASGMVWSGDSYASTRNASMTSGVLYINGRRLTATTVTSRSFTASKDTYIDASDNGDGTALLTYTEVANNATSPSLAANSVRIGIIVTGASNIASAGSVNQGQEDKVLPTVSSNPLQTTDTSGNLICPRDPNRQTLGVHTRVTQAINAGGTAVTDLMDLAIPVIVPTGRKIKFSVQGEDLYASVNNASAVVTLWEGTVGSGRQLLAYRGFQNGGSGTVGVGVSRTFTPLTSNPTLRVGLASTTTGNSTIDGSSSSPITATVELV